MDENKIVILPKDNVSIAKFIADSSNDMVYYAHPATIKAMKKDIFAYSDILNAEPLACSQCHKLLHSGMWHYCPHCENKLFA